LLLLLAACGTDRSRGLPSRPDGATSDGGASDGGGDVGEPECEVDADCEALSGGCAIGRCVMGTCNMTGAAPDGTSCDDDNLCTTGDFCTVGRCGGATVDCSALSDGVCVVGACDPATGACAAVPEEDGTGCDDGLACTDGDSCVSGSCVAGAPLDCSTLTDICNVGSCDEGAGGCVQTPLADGVGCDDSDVCTSGDSCSFGTCSGSPVDCSGLDDMCNVGICDPATGGCTTTPAVDGSACSDGDACTSVDRCTAGTCVGTSPVSCTAFTDQCNTGVCDAVTGSCEAVPVTDGMVCDDGDAVCTPGVDTCTAGVCGGPSVCCGAGDFRLNEMAGGTPDFVEIINRGTCTLDASIVGLRFQGGCDTSALTYRFPVGTMVAPGGVVRVTDQTSTVPGEFYFGTNICHNEYQGAWAMLCNGACSASSCAGTLDYFEQSASAGTRPVGASSCASFTPGALDASSALSTQSATRIAFVGGGAAGLRSDWALRTVSR
jgi:hypothetical protein